MPSQPCFCRATPAGKTVSRACPPMVLFINQSKPLEICKYRVIPGIRNWQLETADWIWPVSSSVL